MIKSDFGMVILAFSMVVLFFGFAWAMSFFASQLVMVRKYAGGKMFLNKILEDIEKAQVKADQSLAVLMETIAERGRIINEMQDLVRDMDQKAKAVLETLK